MTPSTAWKETIPDGEEAELDAFSRQLADLQTARAAATGAARPDRALHAKGHIALLGHFIVDDNLPEHARQGLFARPGRHHAYLRFSNGSGARAADGKPDVRGLAVKVLEVPGDKVLGDAATQDFLAIDAVRTPVKNPREFVALVRAASGKRLLSSLIGDLGFFRTVGLIASVARGLKGRPGDLLDTTFNTVLPIKFGPYAARLAFVPRHEPSPAWPKSADRDYLAARLAERAAKGKLRWEVQAQFFTGAETPIEDPSVAWTSPMARVGELESEALDPRGERGRALTDFVERMSFDPWHALKEHQPLGAMMRARKATYFLSTKNRQAAAEPDGSEWESFVAPA